MTDLLIVGAGPSGLACAIEARGQGLTSCILEQGGIADAIRRFPTNLVWFSTPELLSLGDVPFVTSTVRPTRVDTLNYYHHVVRRYALDLRLHDAVNSIRRNGDSAFEVRTVGGRTYAGRAVVIATGYLDHPARLGVPGEENPRVLHAYDEPFRYAGSTVLVVGGRNSAVEAALDLYRHGAHVTLVHRGLTFSHGVKYWILPDIENRIKAGQIRALFGASVREFRVCSAIIDSGAGSEEVRADFSFVLIGYLPDSSFLRDSGVELDPVSLAPRCNPGTFETNVPGLFVAGSVVAGRDTNKIFVENGRMHCKPIIAAIRSRAGSLP